MRRLLCLIAMLSLAILMWAQGTTSRITGLITDKTGAVIPGATVTVTDPATKRTYTTKSSGTGVYVFDSLQIGKYTVSVEAPGFKKFVSTDNVLSIGLPTTVNAALEVGSTGETVEVKGGYDLIQTETSGNFGSVIDSITMTQQPIVQLRSRSPLAFVYLVPGVQDNCNTGGCISIHGSRDRAWNYTLDGVDVNESTSGGSNTTPARSNPDSISEFRVISSNFTPEYGRNSGAQVTMVTKSGTNNFHGNAFWFYQSPFLMANNAATKAAQLAAQKPNQRSQFVQNIAGGSVGGPIRKNKDFFFVNVQLLHAKNSYLVNRTVYTPLARQGKFRYVVGGRNQPYGVSGNSVDASGNPVAGLNIATYDMVANDPAGIGLDPAIQSFLNLTPLPNNYSGGDGLNTAYYTFVAPQLEKQVDLTFKVDHTFNENNAIFVRWYQGHQNTFADQVNGGLVAFPGLPNFVDTYRKPRNLAINWRYNPTSHTTNELVIGENYFGYIFANPNPDVAQVPPYEFNLVTVPLSSWANNNRYANTYQLVDNFTWARGAHTYKFGFNGRYLREIDQRGSIGVLNAEPQVYFGTGDAPVDSTIFKLPATGSSGINSSADLPRLRSAINDLLGRIGQIQQGYVASKDMQTFRPARTWNNMDHRWPEYDFYFQDTWKIKSNLTLDYGVRWEIRMAPNLVSFPALVPNQSVLFGLTPSDTLAWTKGKVYNSDYNNLGPSVGLAWDPWKDGKTSVRVHYRIAYDRINPFSFSSSVFQGMPGLTTQVIATPNSLGTAPAAETRAKNWFIPAPAPGVTPQALTALPAYSVNAYTVADPNMRTPKVYQWGLSIQREIMKNTVFSLTYNGNHGVGLYGGYNANQAQYNSNGFLAAFNTVRAGGESALFDQIFAPVRKTATGAAYARANYASYLNYGQVAGLAGALANQFVGSVPLVVAAGMNPYFFRPYPQALGGMFVLDTNGYSVYHDLEAQVERRFSNGLLFQFSWTWAKSLDTRSYDPAFTRVSQGSGQSAQGTPYNILQPHLNWGPSDFDRTHTLQFNWVYDLPFGKGKRFASGANRILDALVGGWEVAGNGVWETGRPITFLANGYTYSSDSYTPVSCYGKCDPYIGNKFWGGGSVPAQAWFLDMAPLLPSSQSSTGLDSDLCRSSTDGSYKLCIPAPGQMNNIGRNFWRQGRYANLNATIGKTFKIVEGHTLQARLEMQNVTNSVMFDTFGSQIISSSVFSRMNVANDGITGSNSQRRMQLSLKYTF
jgi:hypothetical protein